MKFILGKKLEMSQTFDEEGNAIPVTLIEAGPCFVTQIKTKEKDDYDAVQVGFKKKKKSKKTEKGKEFKFLKEFPRIEASKKPQNASRPPQTAKEYKVGDKIDVSVFERGDKVKVSGISKGKGFQGVVKRWNFSGLPASHGTKNKERSPGSIGSAFPERVWPGKKMPGRMGYKTTTIANLEVVKVDPKKNLMAIKGAVPGPKGALLEIRTE